MRARRDRITSACSMPRARHPAAAPTTRSCSASAMLSRPRISSCCSSRSWRCRAATRNNSRRCCGCAATAANCYTATDILPVAERAGLTAEIDRWVLSHCLLVLAERARLRRPVRLFVSQTMDTARDAQRIGWLKQLLETRRLAGEQLVLEFRLSEAQENLRELTAFIGALQGLGVTLSLSAFESNQASLQLLHHLPVTFIKLAPRYIGEGLRNPALREEFAPAGRACA